MLEPNSLTRGAAQSFSFSSALESPFSHGPRPGADLIPFTLVALTDFELLVNLFSSVCVCLKEGGRGVERERECAMGVGWGEKYSVYR